MLKSKVFFLLFVPDQNVDGNQSFEVFEGRKIDAGIIDKKIAIGRAFLFFPDADGFEFGVMGEFIDVLLCEAPDFAWVGGYACDEQALFAHLFEVKVEGFGGIAKEFVFADVALF